MNRINNTRDYSARARNSATNTSTRRRSSADALLESALSDLRMTDFLFEEVTRSEIAATRAKLTATVKAFQGLQEALPESMGDVKGKIEDLRSSLSTKLAKELTNAAVGNDPGKTEFISSQCLAICNASAGLIASISGGLMESSKRLEKTIEAMREVAGDDVDLAIPGGPLQGALADIGTGDSAFPIDKFESAVANIFKSEFKAASSSLSNAEKDLKAARGKTQQSVLGRIKSFFTGFTDDYLDKLKDLGDPKPYFDSFMQLEYSDISDIVENLEDVKKSISGVAQVQGTQRNIKSAGKRNDSEPPPEASTPSSRESEGGTESQRPAGELTPSDSMSPATASEPSSGAPTPAPRGGDVAADKDKTTARKRPLGRAKRKISVQNADSIQQSYNYDELKRLTGSEDPNVIHDTLKQMLRKVKDYEDAGVVFESKRSKDDLIVERWNVLAGTNKKK